MILSTADRRWWTYGVAGGLLAGLLVGCTLFNRPPLASITADVLTGESPLVVTLSGLESHDPDGTIVSYAWDFGDGESAAGVTVAHTYVVTGEMQVFTVRLTVTDDDEAQATAEQTIEVRPRIGDSPLPGAGLPTARFDLDAFIGVGPLDVTFNAADSTAGTGDIVAYNWDFGDGTKAKGIEVTHTFNPEQTTEHRVTLFVWDEADQVDAEEKVIVVIVPENDTGDPGPIAEATLVSIEEIYDSDDPRTVPSLFEASLDPRGSSSSAGHTLEYFAWDFGDGEFQVDTSDLVVSHIYELGAPMRTYVATLTVYDDQGEEDSMKVNVTLINEIEE